MSVKLLGFALWEKTEDPEHLARIIRGELMAARDLLGSQIATLSHVKHESDLVFLRTCIELRIPTIVLLSDPALFLSSSQSANHLLLSHLLSVSLASYTLPETNSSLPILEWSDALISLGRSEDDAFTSDAVAMGIPLRRVDAMGNCSTWTHLPRADTDPKHGFPTRRELLDFLDRRYGT